MMKYIHQLIKDIFIEIELIDDLLVLVGILDI